MPTHETNTAQNIGQPQNHPPGAVLRNGASTHLLEASDGTRSSAETKIMETAHFVVGLSYSENVIHNSPFFALHSVA